MLSCTILGYLQLRYSVLRPSASSWHVKGVASGSSSGLGERRSFRICALSRGLIVVGSLRFSTIFLGLVALWFVPVSFAETVKSSAPVFTVIVSWLLLGERSSVTVLVSLIPVVGGLVLCSAFEINFTVAGLVAALATNLSECLQNVYSKRLLNVERYSSYELQFYSAASSFFLQVPCLILLYSHSAASALASPFTSIAAGGDERDEQEPSLSHRLMLLVLCGVSFHFNSLAEYMILSLISPVTHR